MGSEPMIANPERLSTRCCIAGGGPAGMMAGFLLARAGIEVVVLVACVGNTQRMQILIQNQVLAPALRNSAPIRSLPLPLKLLNAWPVLRRIPARILGMGFRPEHVKISSGSGAGGNPVHT